MLMDIFPRTAPPDTGEGSRDEEKMSRAGETKVTPRVEIIRTKHKHTYGIHPRF